MSPNPHTLFEPNETRRCTMAILTGLLDVLSALLAAALRRLRSQPAPAAGFFHPHTNDGGGGERVLWCAVRAVQGLRPDLPCAVFTSDADASPERLAARALDRFGVRLLRPLQVRRGPICGGCVLSLEWDEKNWTLVILLA
jgi:hypothetical protein